ncbi:unnamed protein product, partial [Mesorhabditis spiculigera]
MGSSMMMIGFLAAVCVAELFAASIPAQQPTNELYRRAAEMNPFSRKYYSFAELGVPSVDVPRSSPYLQEMFPVHVRSAYGQEMLRRLQKLTQA